MPARLSKRQQRELEELTHVDEIGQAGESSGDEDARFASVPAQSAFAAVSQRALLEIAERFTLDRSFKMRELRVRRRIQLPKSSRPHRKGRR